jgi:hypothetical protein
VNALLTGKWSKGSPPGDTANPNRALVWPVQHDVDDMTSLMRNAIAAPLVEELLDDDQMGAGTRFLDGAKVPAAASELVSKLTLDRPGLIVTTSHGMTGPLDNKEAMKREIFRKPIS